MYLSKRNKLLFVAIPRTASNSVQKAILDSDITDPTDVVYNLLSVTEKQNIKAYHSVPAMLVDKNVLTAAELSECTAFGFIREPFERWVSAIFLARHLELLDASVDPFDQICDLVRSGPSPRPFLAADNAFTPEDYASFSYRDYFFIDDTQVATAYRWDDAEAVTKSILEDKLGTPVTAAFPNIQVNPNGVPVQFKEPIESWLPADCYAMMSNYFADETAFFNATPAFEA
jgi:hypothetical protein